MVEHGDLLGVEDHFLGAAGLLGPDMGLVEDDLGLLDCAILGQGYRELPSFAGEGGGMYGWAYREGDFKVVVAEGIDTELYNVVEDPLEQSNLLADGVSDNELAVVEGLTARRTALLDSAN